MLRWRTARQFFVVIALLAGLGAALDQVPSRSNVHAAADGPPRSELTAAEQAQPACPDAIGGLGITPFQQRSNNPGSTQFLSCTYVAPVGTIGEARFTLRWNDLAGTASQQCESATLLREQLTTSAGNPQIKLWSATRQIWADGAIIQAGPAAGIGDVEAVIAGMMAANEPSALPCAPDPQPIQPGSLECPPRIEGLVWLGFYSSGDIGKPEPRTVAGNPIPGLLLNCHYRTAYKDVEGRSGITIQWVEPGSDPPRDEDCRDYGRDRAVYSDTHAAQGSYEDPSQYAGVASEDAVRAAMLALFAAAEQRSAPCQQAATSTPAPPTASATTEPTTARDPESCAPFGVVTDHRGDPMPGLRVQLHLAGEVVDQRVTDDGGAFQFEDIAFFAEAFDFDLADDEYEVGAVLRDAVEGEARFQVHYGDAAVLPDVRTRGRTIEDDPSCESNIAFANIDDSYRVELGPAAPEEWRSLAFTYQHLRIAWNFATEQLGVTMDHMLPLRLYSYCSGSPDLWWGFTSCGSRAASYLNAVTSDPLQEGPPLIQFNRSFSRRPLTGNDRPVNGEYHEFGHAVMADAFGNLMPGRPDHQNHAGYANPSSTDSWTEGFAEWFAVMVQRHEVGGQWWLYTVGGPHSLEDDRQATGRGGRDEELSIAGILVDMVDSAADYAAPTERRLTVLDGGLVEDPDEPGKTYYAVEFRNDTGVEQRNIAYRLDYGGFRGAFSTRIDGLVDPAVLGPGEVGQGLAPLPASVGPDGVNSVRVVGFSAEDDDGVSHTPREVWEAIVSYRGTGEHGNGFVIDVSELYEALITAFPDEQAAIDQIFINHGWYADIGSPPNGRYDPGEEIGITSPDGARLRTAPERDAVFDARLDTGAVAASAFVQVLYPEPREALSYAFEATVDEATGTVALAVPPAETGAVLRIVLRADGHLPVLLDDIEAATFWEQANAANYQPFVTLTATMVEGELFTDGADEASIAPELALAGAAGVIALGIAAVFFGERTLRRRRAA